MFLEQSRVMFPKCITLHFILFFLRASVIILSHFIIMVINVLEQIFVISLKVFDKYLSEFPWHKRKKFGFLSKINKLQEIKNSFKD